MFVQIPAALCCARACEVLDLSLNPHLQLSRADVEGTLLRMHRLGLLLLGRCPGCTAPLNWRTGGSHCQEDVDDLERGLAAGGMQ